MLYFHSALIDHLTEAPTAIFLFRNISKFWVKHYFNSGEKHLRIFLENNQKERSLKLVHLETFDQSDEELWYDKTENPSKDALDKLIFYLYEKRDRQKDQLLNMQNG